MPDRELTAVRIIIRFEAVMLDYLSPGCVSMQGHSEKLKVQEADGGKSRSWRRNVARLNLSVSRLEEDMEKLEKVFPQVSVQRHGPLRACNCTALSTCRSIAEHATSRFWRAGGLGSRFRRPLHHAAGVVGA